MRAIVHTPHHSHVSRETAGWPKRLFRRRDRGAPRRKKRASMRIVVGISGSSSPIYGIRTLEALGAAGVEVHLVISGGARLTIPLETRWTVEAVRASRTPLMTIRISRLRSRAGPSAPTAWRLSRAR